MDIYFSSYSRLEKTGLFGQYAERSLAGGESFGGWQSQWRWAAANQRRFEVTHERIFSW